MSGPPAPATLRSAEFMAALSLATDLANGFPLEGSLRTCLIAVRLAERHGLRGKDLSDAYYLTLLRSIACTAFAHEEGLAFGDDVGYRSLISQVGGEPEMFDAIRHAGLMDAFMKAGPGFSDAMCLAHADVGARLAARLGMSDGVCTGLGQVYERWDGGGMPRHLTRDQLPLPTRIMHLSFGVEMHRQTGGAAAAVGVARARAGGAYDPDITRTFVDSASEILDGIADGSVWDAALDSEPEPRCRASALGIEDTCRALADLADLKSLSTLGHSSRVARLAEAAAAHLGSNELERRAVRQSALVHDLGRVAVPGSVWSRPSTLTASEWERVRLHPYHSERVLSHAGPLAALARLAGSHHERLDGSGYHRGVPGAMIPLLARVLSAADVYAALTDERPHRPALDANTAADALAAEVAAGHLDAQAVEAVQAAVGLSGPRTRQRWPAGLTDREVEVLRFVARGSVAREVAMRLGISERTVQHHVAHIYDKIGVTSRAGAALFAMEHDLLLSQG